jgi:GNAT superfamily N-acetyltransferase
MIESRTARREDADQIAEAHVAAWRVAYRGLFPDEFLDSDEFASSRLERWRSWQWMSFVGSELFVPVIDGEVVGFGHAGPERVEAACDQSGADGAAVELNEGRGEVYGFYLHPKAWGSGVAAGLMSACEEHLRDSGFESAVLWVLRDNPRARGFYERAGWSPSGETGEWEGVPEVQYRVTFFAG